MIKLHGIFSTNNDAFLNNIFLLIYKLEILIIENGVLLKLVKLKIVSWKKGGLSPEAPPLGTVQVSLVIRGRYVLQIYDRELRKHE
jgi:hypothetical protein